MAVVNVQGVYALQGQNKHFPLGAQVGSYGAAKTYVNQFFTRGMAKDAIFAEVMIWSVGGKTYWRRFKDGQWSKWTSRLSKLPNPRHLVRNPAPSRARLERDAYGGYILRVGGRQALIFRDSRATGWSAYEIDQYGDQIDFDATVHDYSFKALVKDMEARLSEPQVRNPAPSRDILAAVGRYVLSVDPDVRLRLRRTGKADAVSVGRHVLGSDPNGFDRVVQYLREEGLIRNPRHLVRNPYAKKFIPPGGKYVQYVYSPEDVAKRHAAKASRISALKAKEAALRDAVRRDVGRGDVTALAVGLILETYERPGNAASARTGHYGVTGWECRHMNLKKNIAVLDYVAKSGVHQTKTIRTPWLVRGLQARNQYCKAKGTRLLPVSASSVNRYLADYDVSAKDLRTFGANTEMQRELKSIRDAGPPLGSLKPRDVAKVLKAEFNAALGVVAAKLGHTTSVLRKQYLVQTLEPAYLATGAIIKTFK